MSYRFVRVTNNYPQFIQAFYKKHPDAAALPYREQHALITEKSVEPATSYTKNLNLIGVEAFNIITNAAPLQNAWKKENNLPEGISLQETIMKQLQFYTPDVLWID